jgi:hydrogenase expression/formation protein HypE
MMMDLVDQLFRAAFDSPELRTRHDGAVLAVPAGTLAMSTDSYVIKPLFFPGGDIGSLAINGTVNDLAMCGARPLCLSVAFILEEGLPLETLWRVALSMRAAADRAGTRIVTGDTKVVERGHGDGVYINTTGIGFVASGHRISPTGIRAGDAILISGDVGRHGMAVLGQRESLSFKSPIKSDCAPLVAPVMELLERGVRVHCLRDATRGGLAAALNETATDSRLGLECDQAAIPVDEAVGEVCEILGLDPLHIANEGCFIAFVDPSDADAALKILKKHNPRAARIGSATTGEAGSVVLRTEIGGWRVLEAPYGELLPRIC